VGRALQDQINLLSSRGFKVIEVYTDPQRSVSAVEDSFPEIKFDASGAGDHVTKVDIKIRRLKETSRSVVHGLPFKVPRLLVKDLVTYVVNRINVRRTTGLTDNRAPRVMFTGQRVDYKKEFRAAFGDYVEAYRPRVQSNAVDQPRSEACIALYPSANLNGSWILYSLVSHSRVRRTNFKVMKMNDHVLNSVKAMTDPPIVVTQGQEDQANLDSADQEPDAEEIAPMDEVHDPREVRYEFHNSGEEPRVESEELELGNEVGAGSREAITTRSGRVIRSTQNPDYAYATKGDDPEADAYVDELTQLFVEKEVLEAVRYSNIPRKLRRKILRSFMFLKKKVLPDGSFDKFKARLVGDGRDQDKEFMDVSSPTAEFAAILIALKYAAVKSLRGIKIDIKGAFLNALLDEPVYMFLDKRSSEIAVGLFPYLKAYLVNGRLYVLVKKALYGLVQSSLLWYNTIRVVLLKNGFVELKSCVFKSGENILILYVDDLLVLSKDGSFFEKMKKILTDEFGEITTEDQGTLNYLGMSVCFGPDGINLSMKGYVDSIGTLPNIPITESKYLNEKKDMNPTAKDLFSIDVNSQALDDDNRKVFHTTVAKLLYLSKRVRPDLLLGVSFLCTRVSKPTMQDASKLSKVFSYLMKTKSKGLKLSSDGTAIDLEIFVDASFSTHEDGKGHSGCIMMLGGSMVYASSRKQKICTKDSTEAEIVGLSDNLVHIESVNALVNKIFDMNVKPKVYQDNQSVIKLIEGSVGKQRTKHVTARLACVKEKARDWTTTYLPTEFMLADPNTKPKGTKGFHKMMHLIMNGLNRARNVNPMEKWSEPEKEQDNNEVMTTRVRWNNRQTGHQYVAPVVTANNPMIL
jgi:hypothetical protein